MKNAILVFLLVIFSSFSYSQDDFINYKNILESTEDQYLKLAAIDSILGIHWKDRKFDDFIEYTYANLTLAERLGKFDQMAKKAMNVSHPLISFKNEPQKAIDIINSVLKYESKLTDSFLKGGLYLKRGGAYFRINTQSAKDDYSIAIDLFDEKDGIHIADDYLFRGQANSNLGLFVQASDDYKKAYDLYEKAGNFEYMLHARSGEIIMYSKNGFIEKAIQQREVLMNEIKTMNLNNYLSTHLYNQSIDYKKINNYEMRFLLLEEALKYADSSNNPYFNYTAIYSSLSEHFSLKNDIDYAELYLTKANEYLPKITNNRIANSIYLMAEIQYFIAKNNWILARDKAKERLELIKNLGLDEETSKTHQTLSEIYLKMGDSENAYHHLNLYTKLRDSILDQNKINALVYYQTLYETERKENELSEKLSNIAILEEKNSSLRRQYLLGGVTILFGFSMFFLIKNQRDLKQKKNMQEQFAQDLLIAQEDERKRVSKDLHDGIGQSLLLIKNKVVLNNDDKTKSLVENAIEEVRTISRALHPFQLQELGITKAIQNIVFQMDESTELFITSDINNIDSIFNQQQEVNIYRIIQESLNNVLKHSQAKGVNLKVIKYPKHIKITIKDNGIGFDFIKRNDDFKSLGLKTLKERTRLLNGSIKIESQPEKGTTLEFLIPHS